MIYTGSFSIINCKFSSIMIRRTNVCLMLGQRRRRCPSINPALAPRLLFVVMAAVRVWLTLWLVSSVAEDDEDDEEDEYNSTTDTAHGDDHWHRCVILLVH